MHTRRYDLVICDIDGCLQPESTDPMDLAHLRTIAEHNERAASRGDRPLLTLCSGRPQPFAEAMCKLLRIRGVPCVCENGVWLYDLGPNRYEMDPAILPEHREAVRAASAWVEKEYGARGVTEQPGKAGSVSLYHPDTAYLRSIAPRITEEFAARGWPFRVSMTWLYINCDLKHISKSTGIDRLVARTGFTRDRLVGIGDTTSDLTIRERVGFFACPANAQDEIKRVADYVSPHPEAAGVVDILARVSA
jgi:hydroxymethylpyrimidine pyrophosphatase-like HAD family hydrolase